MGELDPASGRHLDKITISQLIAHVLANTQDDDLMIEMPVFEEPAEAT